TSLTSCGVCSAPSPTTATTALGTCFLTWADNRSQVTWPSSSFALPFRPSMTWWKKTPCLSLGDSKENWPPLQEYSTAVPRAWHVVGVDVLRPGAALDLALVAAGVHEDEVGALVLAQLLVQLAQRDHGLL